MRIAEIRKAKHYTQKQLAEACNVSVSVISRYESGKLAPPISKLRLLAEFFDVSLDEIMSDGTSFEPSPVSAPMPAEELSFCETPISAPAPRKPLPIAPAPGRISSEVTPQEHPEWSETFHSVSDDLYFPVLSPTARRVLELADGCCELCGHHFPAGPNGESFLEIHYIQWLTLGGSPEAHNAVALCPNCHKRVHFFREPEVLELLKKHARLHADQLDLQGK